VCRTIGGTEAGRPRRVALRSASYPRAANAANLHAWALAQPWHV